MNANNKWYVICEPEDDNGQGFKDLPEGEAAQALNQGGLAVYVVQDSADGAVLGYKKKEIARVAFIRKNSANPKSKFTDALAKVLETAFAVCKTLNDTEAAAIETRARRAAEARTRATAADQAAKDLESEVADVDSKIDDKLAEVAVSEGLQ